MVYCSAIRGAILGLELNFSRLTSASVRNMLYRAVYIYIATNFKPLFFARLDIEPLVELSPPVLSFSFHWFGWINWSFVCDFSGMCLAIFVAVGERWTVVDGLWQWIGEEKSRLMVVDESILLRELHEWIFEKLGINKEEFNLKLSFVPKSTRRIGSSYMMDDEDVEAFLLGQTKNIIDTML